MMPLPPMVGRTIKVTKGSSKTVVAAYRNSETGNIHVRVSNRNIWLEFTPKEDDNASHNKRQRK